MNKIDQVLLLIRHPNDFTIVHPTVKWLCNQLNCNMTIFLSQATLNLSGKTEDQFENVVKEWRAPPKSIKTVLCENPSSCMIQSNADKQKALCIVVTASDQIRKPSMHMDPDTSELIAQSLFPILLIPENYRSKFPWSSILVPMEGNLRINRALDIAISVGNTFHSHVIIVHVLESTIPQKDHHSPMENLSDEVHHEAPEMLDDLISAASPFSSMLEKKVIHGFSVIRGKAIEQIMRELKKRKADIIAVQWGGRFNAQTIKTILEHLHLPILLVKPESSAPSQLKAGHQLAS